MQLKLKRFNFSNVFAYGDNNSVVLDEDRVTIVTGDNGAGKSSLPNALEEVLYNKNSRGIKKGSVTNRHATNPTVLELLFELNDVEYRLVKTVKATAKVQFYENGKEISGHTTTQTYKIIEEKIGLDFATFTKLVYQSTKSSLDFLSATDANRKKFLIGLLGLEKYAVIEAELKAQYKVAASERDLAKGKLKTLEDILSKATTVPDIIEIQELPDDSEISTIMQEITELNVQSTNLSSTNDKIAKANGTEKDLINKLEASEARLTALSPADPCDEVTESLREATESYTRINTLMGAKKSTYQKFKSSADKTECPTCGTALDVTEAAKARDLAKSEWLVLKEDRDTASEKLEALKALDADYNKYKKYIADKDTLEAKVSELNNKLITFREDSSDYLGKEQEDLYTISDKIAKLRGTMTRLKSEISKIQESNNAALVSNARRDDILQQLEEAKSGVDSARKDYESANEKCIELEILIKAFSSKGLVAYKIEHSIKAIEQGINEYLSVLTSGRFALGFELDGSKLDVVVYDDGDKVEINALSSGQFTKVQLSTLLAIRKVLSAVSSVDVNFLFIDETMSLLDEQSKNTLVEVLLEEKDLNVFLVSHGYSHPLARSMNVVNVDGMSRIEV